MKPCASCRWSLTCAPSVQGRITLKCVAYEYEPGSLG